MGGRRVDGWDVDKILFAFHPFTPAGKMPEVTKYGESVCVFVDAPYRSSSAASDAYVIAASDSLLGASFLQDNPSHFLGAGYESMMPSANCSISIKG